MPVPRPRCPCPIWWKLSPNVTPSCSMIFENSSTPSAGNCATLHARFRLPAHHGPRSDCDVCVARSRHHILCLRNRLRTLVADHGSRLAENSRDDTSPTNSSCGGGSVRPAHGSAGWRPSTLSCPDGAIVRAARATGYCRTNRRLLFDCRYLRLADTDLRFRKHSARLAHRLANHLRVDERSAALSRTCSPSNNAHPPCGPRDDRGRNTS